MNMYTWIMKRFAENRTVYIKNGLSCAKLTNVHISRLRVRDGYCELAYGKYWYCISGSKIHSPLTTR